MARTFTVEKRIAQEHGDPQVVIPREVNAGGQVGAARKLNVRQSWLSAWLKRNGYRSITRWEKLS